MSGMHQVGSVAACSVLLVVRTIRKQMKHVVFAVVVLLNKNKTKL